MGLIAKLRIFRCINEMVIFLTKAFLFSVAVTTERTLCMCARTCISEKEP